MSDFEFGVAGAEQERLEPESGKTKVCPQCGAVLFEDMPICYSCLYDFERPVAEETPWYKAHGSQKKSVTLNIGEGLEIQACGLSINICASDA